MDARGRQARGPELYPTDECALCGSARATMQHMLWGCLNQPPTTTTEEDDDPLSPSVRDAVTSVNYELQKMAAELALAAIERQRPKVRLSTTLARGPASSASR
ncbi:hypothetical protein HPB48_007251 [Haemaphysalis longicornis]|uniref:Uncharacterized protein n=1 Tax=Haemaphysalis longicornis TaxID=44386 RepID=A0A9J6FQM3_HAELO|nr:hypothetical protein HPB48_007251 [Haemaphysalis longicornis]